MESDFAYVLGALGDATLTYRKDKGKYCVEFEQKNKAWLQDSIVPRLHRLFGKTLSVKKRKSGLFRVRLYSKDAYLKFKLWLPKAGKILELPNKAQLCFVRGFFDAEGSAPKRKNGTQYRIQMYQKNRRPLEIISRILEANGIVPGRITNAYDVGQLPIRTKANTKLFLEIVGSEHPEKKLALVELCL